MRNNFEYEQLPTLPIDLNIRSPSLEPQAEAANSTGGGLCNWHTGVERLLRLAMQGQGQLSS